MTRHKWDLKDTCEKCGCIRSIIATGYKGMAVMLDGVTSYRYSYDNGKTWDKNTGCKPYESTEDIINRKLVTPV